VQTVVLTDIVGVDRISKAFGILLLVQGIAVFVGPPFAGAFLLFSDWFRFQLISSILPF
jgi:hypothetical protein